MTSERAAAQSVGAFTPLDSAASTPTLNVLVTVHASSRALRDVIADLAQQAAVTIAFDPALSALDGRISVTLDRVPVAKALLRVLAGTNLQALVSSSGSIVLTERVATREDSRAPVDGRTRQSDGQPLEAVRLSLTGTRFEATSDANGQFTFGSVPAGTYTLRALRMGFAPNETTVRVGNGNSRPLVVDLTPAAVPVDAVIVTPGYVGVMQSSIANAHALTRQQIETVPQLGEDVYRTIGRLPGVATDDFSANFNVRGQPSQSLYVTLDGVPLVEPFHLRDISNALSIVDLASLGRAELITGGPSAEYGGQIAGVFSLHSVEPRQDRARTSVGISLTNVRAMSQGGFAGDKGAWLISARRGFLDLAFKVAHLDDSLKPRYNDLFGKVTYAIPGGGRLGLHVLHAGDRLTYRSDQEPSLDSHYTSDYLWLTAEGHAGARLRYSSVAWVDHFDWRRTGSQVGAPPLLVEIHDARTLRTVGLRQDWSADLGRRALVKLGVEGTHNVATYDYSKLYSRNVATHDQVIVQTDTGSANLEPVGDQLGVYISQRVQPIDAVTLEAGARYDHASQSGDSYVSPRFNAAWQATRSTTVRAAAGEHAQSQSVFELQVEHGVRDFQPAERARQVSVGVDQSVWRDVALRAEVYDRTVDHVRSRYTSAAARVYPLSEIDYALAFVDPERVRDRGVELTLERAGAPHVDWAVSYVRSSARQRLDGVWLPRPTDQPHAAHVDWSYHPASNRWHFSVSGQRRSGWPFSPETIRIDTVQRTPNTSVYVTRSPGALYTMRAAPYQRLDARWTRFFDTRSGRVSLFVDVYNVLNNSNERERLTTLNFTPTGVRYGEWSRVSLPRIPSFGINWEF